MINTRKYTIVERSQMNQILKEQGLQKSGCTETSCAVEIGKLLSAKKILVGTVMSMGRSIIITGRIVDVEKGIGEFSARSVAKSHDGLIEAVSKFTIKLTGRIENTIEEKNIPTTEEESVKKNNIIPKAITNTSWDLIFKPAYTLDTFDSNGFSLEMGVEHLWYYIGIDFTYIPSQDIIENEDELEKFDAISGSVKIYYTGWSWEDIIIFCPGLFVGYYQSYQENYSNDDTEKEKLFGGICFKLELGYKWIHLFAETKIWLGKTKEFNDITGYGEYGFGFSPILNIGIKFDIYSF